MPTNTETETRIARQQKRITALRARKVSLMNNSKWARLFDTLWHAAGLQYAQAKPLDSDQLYKIELEIYSDQHRGYTSDCTAPPIALVEIEYIIIPLPQTVCRQTLAAALAKSGQYETEWLAGSLKIYGYR